MEERVTIGDAANLLGYSVDTLRRWDESSRLTALREKKDGYRYYPISKLENFSKSLDRFKIAGSWVQAEDGFEPLPCYYCSDSFIFQSRLSRMERDLRKEKEISDFLSLVIAVAGEIGNNSFDHNIGRWPDIPGVFFSYDLEERKIVLADRGQGVLKTLKRVRPGLSNHKEALMVAFTEIISGRSPEHRGNGLKFVKSAVGETKMRLLFQTGNAELTLKEEGSMKVGDMNQKIKGCLAQIMF